MLCWVSWHMQTGKKEEGSYSPDRQLCCGQTGESAVDREVSWFCTAELTFIITDGQNEPASGKALSTF